MSTDTALDITLLVENSSEVSCEIVDGCGSPAAWKMVITHAKDKVVCATPFACDKHAKEMTEALRSARKMAEIVNSIGGQALVMATCITHAEEIELDAQPI